jgi:hypothetical protein
MDVRASTLVHRLLFDALTEIRDEGSTAGNTLVFHLSDLFHQAVLQMEQASEGGPSVSYETVLESLKNSARRKGSGEWVDRHIEQIEARIHAGSAIP